MPWSGMDIRRAILLPFSFQILASLLVGQTQLPAPPCPTADAQSDHFWTDYASQSGNQILGGEGIHIKSGDRVYLNTTPAALRFIWVEGDLVFDGCHGAMDIPVAAILVDDGGNLQIGSEQWTYPVEASITLTESKTPPNASELSILGISDPEVQAAISARGLIVDGGALRLFGEDGGNPFEKLASTIDVTDTSTALPVDMDLEVGDEILLTPTGFDHQGFDVVALTQVTSSHLHWGTSALNNEHYADTTAQDFTPLGGSTLDWEVQEQGEIASLSRNIVIRGEEDPPNSDSFPHVMIMKSQGTNDIPVVRVNWAGFENLGDHDEAGRYSLHLHQLGDLGSLTPPRFIRDTLVRGSRNHGIVIHDTDGMEVSGNVVHDVAGYGIYLQGTSQDNLVKNNLVNGGDVAMDVAQPGDIFAGFNIKSPQNVVEFNTACGFRDYGFYLVPNDHYAATGTVSFLSNEAHSIGDIGFFQNTLASTDDVVYEGLFAWKCRNYGGWIRSVKGYTLKDSKFADCRAGFYPASEGIRKADGGDQTITNCLFVGKTANDADGPAQVDEYVDAHHLKWDVVTGIEVYDGLVRVEDCRFAEFEDLARSSGTTYPDDYSLGAGLTQVAKHSTWAVDPRNSVSGLEFGTNVDRELYFRDPATGDNQIAFTTIVDETGCLGFNAYDRYFPNVAFSDPGATATFYGDAFGSPGLNGYRQAAADEIWGHLIIAPDDEGKFGGNDDPTMSIRQGVGPVWDASTTPISQSAGGSGAPQYPINLEVQPETDFLPGLNRKQYQVTWGPEWATAGLPEPRAMSIYLQFTESENDAVFLQIPVGDAPVGYPNLNLYEGVFLIPPLNDLNALLALTSDSHAWYLDSSSSPRVAYIRIVAKLESGHLPGEEGTYSRLDLYHE